MNDIASERVGPMRNPPHLGELIRENMDEVGWNVTETAARLGCERGTLSRLLNGKAGGRRTWRWRWRTSAGAPPITRYGCSRATSLRRRGVTGRLRNGARGRCTHDHGSRRRCGRLRLMRLSWNEGRVRAAKFAGDWQDAAYQKGIMWHSAEIGGGSISGTNIGN